MGRGVFVLLVILLALKTSGQKLEVVDIFSNQPVGNAVLFTEKRKTFLTTSADGSAELGPLIPFDTLFVQHASYMDESLTNLDIERSGNTIYLSPNVIQMPTFELKAARESYIETPRQVLLLAVDEVKNTQPRTTADMLEKSGQVFVQRSQLGGGSPVLRGFEANRILLMIDGVRLNNAIYRSGHLQNAISVDPFLLENTEVLFGPGSLIYGSDALGGVIHFHTKKPLLASSDEPRYSLTAVQRLNSATQESTTHWDATVSGRKTAWLGSFTRARFGKMRMGENRLHGNDEWGLIPEYVQTTAEGDSIYANEDPNVIPNSGYNQYDFAQKLLWQASDSVSLLVNMQYSTTSDVPRSDQLAAYRNGQLRYSEWSYGPQERFLTSLQVDILGDDPAYDKAQVLIAYQKIGEDRLTRAYQDPLRYVREEDVSVISLNIDLVKRWKNKDLYYGLETTSNNVKSSAQVNDVFTDVSEIGPTRYPDGGSRMSSTGAYIDLAGHPSKKFMYNLGVRYSHSYLNSRYNDTTFYTLPFRDIIFDNGAVTGSASMSYKPSETWDIGLSAATGFRSPNVDDYGKVFERSGVVVVPTADLVPEYTLNGELRLERRSMDEKIQLELAGFYTHILDAIVQRPSSLNGVDSLLYEGEWASIAVNTNEEEAFIYGWSAGLVYKFGERWTWSNTATQTIGEVSETGLPLSHIPPFFAKSDLSYGSEQWNYGAYVLYNDTKTKKTIGPGRTDNADEGIDGAFPSWYIAGVYMRYTINRNFELSFHLDNITDTHYKAFASGLSAPGRSLGASLRYSF